MTWTIDQSVSTLAVPDIDLGIEFYTRIGFETDWMWPEGTATHAGLSLGACTIMLSRCDPAERADIYFLVDDVATCHAAMVAAQPWELAPALGEAAKRADCPPDRSTKPPSEPEVRGYGLRDFVIVDPWGHQLTFGEVLPAEESA